jgi:hypothetical protein
MERYHVTNVSHVAEFMDKQQRSCFTNKKYILPSGNIIFLQGYEPYALDDLLRKENVEEINIISNRVDVPVIYWYDEDKKKHRHYVDFYIKNENRCIEVKSIFTYLVDTEEIMRKRYAAIEAGLKYEVYIYDYNKELMMVI